jgi:hypothetical protein
VSLFDWLIPSRIIKLLEKIDMATDNTLEVVQTIRDNVVILGGSLVKIDADITKLISLAEQTGTPQAVRDAIAALGGDVAAAVAVAANIDGRTPEDAPPAP